MTFRIEFAIYTSRKNTPKKANPAKAGDAKPKGLKSDDESGYDSLAAERYKDVRILKTSYLTIIAAVITGLFVSARTAEASPVSFLDRFAGYHSVFGGILGENIDMGLEDLDARDEFNRPIKDARTVWNLRGIFVASLYQMLLTRVSLGAEVVEESASVAHPGFTSVAPTTPVTSNNVSSASRVAVILQFFERLKKYIYSLTSVVFTSLFSSSTMLLILLVCAWSLIFDIERQPPVLKPVFTILRC